MADAVRAAGGASAGPRLPDALEISSRHYYWKLRLAFSKAIELRAYQLVFGPQGLSGTRALDLGCSDGTFTRMLAEAVGLAPPQLGADRDLGALRQAAMVPVHGALVQVDACGLPLRSERFDLVLANGVLAHVQPDPAAALREVRRVLASGGRFVFTVPTARHSDFYWSVIVLTRLGLTGFARARGRRIDRNEGYATLLTHAGWRALAEAAGLRVVRVAAYSDRAVAWRRSLFGAPPLRVLGITRLVPSARFRRAAARVVYSSLRRTVEARMGSDIPLEDADYLLFVTEKGEPCVP